ncbi:hypothetical protein HGA34_05615 [Candidatus Falkowbacteria bacterium]|nr:hypothetical protein [Candidatus Falkowbacteria bacterium]
MKKTAIAAVFASAMMLASIAAASQSDTTFADVSIRLAFERGQLSKSEFRPIAGRMEELLSADGSIDPKWLKEQKLIQLEADLTPYSRTVKLTDGKKVLKVSLN